MKAILAADKHWGIGLAGSLLVSIPADMRYFREMTMGKTVVMGRKTLDSMPGGKPLGGRENIILTRNGNLLVKDAIVVQDTEQLQSVLEGKNTDDVFVIGGGEIYKLLLPLCDTVYVTRIDYIYQADTFFPDLDKDPAWEMVEESEEQTYFNLEYTFRTYRRI